MSTIRTKSRGDIENVKKHAPSVPEIEAQMAAAVTESLPNLKMSTPLKRVELLKPRTHEASKATERHKPCVVMKRTDSQRGKRYGEIVAAAPNSDSYQPCHAPRAEYEVCGWGAHGMMN